MPELPEVETVVRGLQRWAGATLEGLDIIDAKVWFESTLAPEKFRGAVVERIYRHGKYFVFQFPHAAIIGHLRMTGKMLEESSTAIPAKVREGKGGAALQIRCRFRFSKGNLVFFDTRRFGTLTAVESVTEFFHKKEIAPDPFHQAQESLRAFMNELAKTSRPIKATLLDQSIAAGIGNIYADEALFVAKIHPQTPAAKVRDSQKIWDAAVKIMGKSMQVGGTTVIDYIATNGESGRYGAQLRVYGRDGKPCYECGKIIKAIRISGRSSHFCPKCQPRAHSNRHK